MRRFRFAHRLAVFLLFWLGGASATTLMRMSVTEMTRSAESVVRARCIGNAASWDAGEIWTFTTFQVKENWKSVLRE
jgi:hypothetical protein